MSFLTERPDVDDPAGRPDVDDLAGRPDVDDVSGRADVDDVSGRPDVDGLVARLRARVEERRRSGEYPPGLEDDMTAHFRRILHQRAVSRPAPDVSAPLERSRRALGFSAARIPHDSGLPGGASVHRAVAKAVSRQTQGALAQVQAFAQPVQETLEVLAAAVVELSRAVGVDVAQSLESLYDRQAAQEREMAALRFGDPRSETCEFRPWYSSAAFEEEFRGTRPELLARYADVADELARTPPVLDVGCGRGELLELLADRGVESWGVDLDAELVKDCGARGLRVEHGDGLAALDALPDGALGALALIQVVEHLHPQEVVDLVALAAAKVRPGGRVVMETVNPQSLYVYARAFWLDPTHLRPVHPAYLTFLFREAGFAGVDIDWRSPPPADEVLEETPEETPGEPGGTSAPGAGPGAGRRNANIRRLNQLLFAPQDYLLVAIR